MRRKLRRKPAPYPPADLEVPAKYRKPDGSIGWKLFKPWEIQQACQQNLRNSMAPHWRYDPTYNLK